MDHGRHRQDLRLDLLLASRWSGGGGGMYCAPGGGLVSTAPMAIPQPNLQYHNPYTAQAQQVPGGGGAAQPIPIRPTVQTGFHPTGNQPDVSDPMVE